MGVSRGLLHNAFEIRNHVSMDEAPDIEALYRRYSPLLSSLFSSRLSPEDAEEAVNQTFAAAYAEREMLAGSTEGELAAWVSRRAFAEFRRSLRERRDRDEQPVNTAALQELIIEPDWDDRMAPRNIYDVQIDEILRIEPRDGGEILSEAVLDSSAPHLPNDSLVVDVQPSDASIFSTYVSHADRATGLGMTVGQLLAPFSRGTFLDPDGRPISGREADAMELSARAVSADVLALLAVNPDLVHSLTPRQFEEVMAELFGKDGYDVTLTATSRDGGADLFVLDKRDIGSFLYVVECKKYRTDRPVGVGFVRQLFGVVQSKRATAGILATTSYFTRDAKAYQRELRYQLSLRDFASIRGWLRRTAN
jgi:Restriction endonuclease